MDLRPISSPVSDAERAAVDALLGTCAESERSVGLREARGLRHLLLPGLHAIQDRFGWVPPGALGYLCERLHVPPADAFGVASFYALFSLTEQAPAALHVCDDIACHAAGAEEIVHELEQELGPAGKAVDGRTWHRSPCLGQCERPCAALLTVAGEQPRALTLTGVDAGACLQALQTRSVPASAPTRVPQAGRDGGRFPLRLLARVGRADPTSLDDYRAHGGYAALGIALEHGPAEVIRLVSESGLVGRGGAAFPTGRKWQAAAEQPVQPHWLVCNADESEPGTFKDRVLMEEDPFAVVEAMTIAGLAIGAEVGFLYIRGEYPLAHERLMNAITAARTGGFLGDNVLGKGSRFDIEVRKGAGAYICGEETALFASIEGFRGEPRSKPPFPVVSGLFGHPTVVNNVETLVNVLPILVEGVAKYRALGTEGSPGTRLFCLSGHVQHPGLYELPFGAKLSELLDLAGASKPQTILLGGAAGTFLASDELDLTLTFEDARKAGTTLGSGVVMVFDETVKLGPVLERIARFFRDESCGQCVPCRVGTVRQEELVQRLVRGKHNGSRAQEETLLAELGQVMRDASICGLGQTASSAIESACSKLGALRGGAAK